MAFEELQAELASLLNRMTEQPHDMQQLEQQIRDKLREFKALGLPLPQDLVELEAALDAGLTAEAVVRARGDSRVHK